METINDLSEKAAAVAAQHEDLAAAVTEERGARAAVLQVALDAVRPALRALASRIKVSSRQSHLGDVNYDQVETGTHLPERGVHLDTDAVGPGRCDARANSGAFDGSDVFLLTDGRIAWLKYSGGWSRWQGSTTTWEAAVEYSTAEEAARDLVKYDRDGDALKALHAALDAQLSGNATARSAAARERAEKLRAIATLVK